jgi:hypothetical protein
MAKLIGFEQDPDNREGAGMFHFDSGTSRYGFDPELAQQASALKGKIDAAPDERLAKNDATPHARVFSDDTRQAIDAQSPAQAFAPPPALQAAYQRDAAPPPPPPGAGASPGLGIDDVSSAARESVAAGAAARILQGGRYAPGAPGIDPRKMRDTGLLVPSSQATKTEFGAPWDQEQARARIGADQAVGSARERQFQLQAQQEQNQLDHARAIAPTLQQQAAEQQAKFAAIQNRYHAERSAFQADLDDYNKNARVDPGRYMKDAGVLGTIGMAIAQAMGAYASIKTGAPNFAMQIVQGNIDRDIAAQRDEIQNGRASRGNKLASLMDKYGWDLNQGEAALRIAQNKAAANQVQLYQLEAKGPQTQAAGDVMLAELQRDTLKREQDLYNASLGKREVTANEQFVVPKAGSGPRFVADTPEQQAGLLKLLPKEQGADVKDLDPKDRLKLVETYGEKKTDFASVRSTYNDLADAYGYRIDWQRGELLDKQGKPVNADESAFGGKNENIPGVGLNSGGILNRQGAARVKEARDKAAAVTGKALSGASVSPQQAEYISSYLLGDSDAGALRGLQRAVKDMNDVERNTEGSYSEETRAEYDRRQRGINRERKTAPPPVKVGDY